MQLDAKRTLPFKKTTHKSQFQNFPRFNQNGYFLRTLYIIKNPFCLNIFPTSLNLKVDYELFILL